MKNKYLITTDNWFIGPDGKQYKAVWGNVTILEDKFLGITTNRNSSNWYARVGSEDNHVILAGCQIHYAVKRDDKPIVDKVTDWRTPTGDESVEFERPSSIYITE